MKGQHGCILAGGNLFVSEITQKRSSVNQQHSVVSCRVRETEENMKRVIGD
jgi:hypothetical protein